MAAQLAASQEGLSSVNKYDNHFKDIEILPYPQYYLKLGALLYYT
jgi:hypothetical protein